MNKYQYPWWTKIYTLWASVIVFSLLAIMDAIWIRSEHPEGYALFLALIIIQYFFTEFQAWYWPISTEDSGLYFHTRHKFMLVPWSSIESIKQFPTQHFQPYEWHQAFFSSGSLISTKNGEEYVIYKKVNGYNELISKCQEHA